MKVLTLATLLAMASTTITAQVVGDPAAGAKKVAVCQACHGEGGAKPAAPIYPSLAGQSSEYLQNALQAYRDGHRTGGMSAMMIPQVASLSDQDLSDLAAYYSQQEPFVKPKQPATSAPAQAQGQPSTR